MTRRQLQSFIFFTILFPTICASDLRFGADFSVPVIAKEPSTIHGFQMMMNYDPDRFKWRQFNLYFDGGFSYFSQNNKPYYSTLNIYSIAPVVRYTFKRRGPILPYLELSIGVAYLNHTHFEDRNLGIHFAFQDRAGIGALLGPSEKFSLGIHAVHYSNAHLSNHNQGITIPLVLDIGYRFS